MPVKLILVIYIEEKWIGDRVRHEGELELDF